MEMLHNSINTIFMVRKQVNKTTYQDLTHMYKHFILFFLLIRMKTLIRLEPYVLLIDWNAQSIVRKRVNRPHALVFFPSPLFER